MDKHAFRMPAVLSAFIAIAVMFGCEKSDTEAPKDDAVSGASPVPFETGVFETLQASRSIVIHCGNSMRPAAEEIAAWFQKIHKIGVKFNFGGSSQLLPSIELGEEGDLYICHDPYADTLESKDLLERYVVVGYLEPIIIVAPGNPRGIKSLEDLARPGLRLALTDERYTRSGKLVQQAFSEMGLQDQLKANEKMTGRSHNDVATALLAGELDAGIVWNFIATFYRGRLDFVQPGIEFPETRVTICLLKNATDREAAGKFIDMAASKKGGEVFQRHGYTKLREYSE